MRRVARLALRATAATYGALATIPTGLTAAAAYRRAVDGDENASRALLFWAWTGWLSIPLSLVLLTVAPVSLAVDPVDRKWLGRVQAAWARLTLAPFFDVEVRGERELLARAGKRVVVANHASWLDPYVLLAATGDDASLRFVSKREVFWIPLVGWLMRLVGHVPLDRGDRASGKTALSTCASRLAEGRSWSVAFFPEGSRPRAPELGSFKIGAFKLALDAGVPVLPVAIRGTREAMPPDRELFFLGPRSRIVVTVLPEMTAGDAAEPSPAARAEALRDACRTRIARALSTR